MPKARIVLKPRILTVDRVGAFGLASRHALVFRDAADDVVARDLRALRIVSLEMRRDPDRGCETGVPSLT